MDRVARAISLSDRLIRGDVLGPRPPIGCHRTVAIGDPQASAQRVFEVLDHHQLLDEDGQLRSDTQLVSIGDHFDYGGRMAGTVAQAQIDGCRVLTWLAAHPPDQVVILIGNHDAARVMELAGATDLRFATGAELACEVHALKGEDPVGYQQRIDHYMAAFPELPAPGVVVRDFSAYTEQQRELVARLLLARRMRLAAIARRGDRTLLLTHAGVTTRELQLLGIPDQRVPEAIADALEQHLARALDAVRASWHAGHWIPLSLAPLQVMGALGYDGMGGLPEGGGMLYHRPADPDRPGADRSWENERERPRRFHPRTLPAGLHQVAGHTGHPKCVAELIRWRDPALVETPAGLRTLWVAAESIRYELGACQPDGDDAAVLYLIDPSMHRAASASAVELLELTPGSAV